MRCYIVTFETESTESRNQIVDTLKSYGTYCPVNLSCWAIKTDESATQIRDRLMQILDKNERAFVIRSGTEAAWFNSYGAKHDGWMKEHL